MTTTPARTMLITGATGFVGSALVQYFSGAGWNVVALVRNESARRRPGVTYRRFDLTSPRLDPDTFDGVDVFIHAAYLKSAKGVDSFAHNVDGSRLLLDAARRSGVGQSIFISSLAARPDAQSEYGKHKLAASKLFSGSHDAVIRPGLVLGNGGLFATLRDHVEKGGRIPLIAGGRQPLQTVHVNDLVRAIDEVIARRHSGTFTIAETEAVPYRRFYESLCDSLGVTSRFIHVPYAVMSMSVLVGELLGVKLPVNRDNLLGLKGMHATDSESSLRQLGMDVRTYLESLQDLAPQRTRARGVDAK